MNQFELIENNPYFEEKLIFYFWLENRLYNYDEAMKKLEFLTVESRENLLNEIFSQNQGARLSQEVPIGTLKITSTEADLQSLILASLAIPLHKSKNIPPETNELAYSFKQEAIMPLNLKTLGKLNKQKNQLTKELIEFITNKFPALKNFFATNVNELRTRNGLFIVFEGGEGTGKTTQIKLLSEKLDTFGKKKFITREPGGTDCLIAEKIREFLKDPNNKEMTPETELFLFLAARAQHVKHKINEHLNNGSIVICDRFYGSTLAYQHFARGLFDLHEVINLNKFATNDLEPDLTIYLDIDPVIGVGRKGDVTGDRFDSEKLEFHNKVRHGFLHLAKILPNWTIISAADDIPTIHQKIWEQIQAKIQ